MRSPGCAIAVCSIALFASLAANAQELTPEELLRRMSVSLRRVDFEGSFIYQHDGRTDALRIFHQGGEPERERLVSLTGARGEIIRDGHSVTCLQSNARADAVRESRGNAACFRWCRTCASSARSTA